MTTKKLVEKKKDDMSETKKDLIEMKLTIAIMQKQVEDLYKKIVEDKQNPYVTKEDQEELFSYARKNIFKK